MYIIYNKANTKTILDSQYSILYIDDSFKHKSKTVNINLNGSSELILKAESLVYGIFTKSNIKFEG